MVMEKENKKGKGERIQLRYNRLIEMNNIYPHVMRLESLPLVQLLMYSLVPKAIKYSNNKTSSSLGGK